MRLERARPSPLLPSNYGLNCRVGSDQHSAVFFRLRKMKRVFFTSLLPKYPNRQPSLSFVYAASPFSAVACIAVSLSFPSPHFVFLLSNEKEVHLPPSLTHFFRPYPFTFFFSLQLRKVLSFPSLPLSYSLGAVSAAGGSLRGRSPHNLPRPKKGACCPLLSCRRKKRELDLWLNRRKEEEEEEEAAVKERDALSSLRPGWQHWW